MNPHSAIWPLCGHFAMLTSLGISPQVRSKTPPPPGAAPRPPGALSTSHLPQPLASRPLLAPAMADPRLFSRPQCHRVIYHLELHVVMFKNIKFSFALFCGHRQFSQQPKETESAILSILGSEVAESEPSGGLAFSPRSPSLRAPHQELSTPRRSPIWWASWPWGF